MTTLSTAHHPCRDINFTPQIPNVLKRFLSNLKFAKLLRPPGVGRFPGRRTFPEHQINLKAFAKQTTMGANSFSPQPAEWFPITSAASVRKH